MSQLYLSHELSFKVVVELRATVQVSQERKGKAFENLSNAAQDVSIHFI